MKGREENTQFYIYTEPLPDGRDFIQAISYSDGKSPVCCCRNPSVEVYNADRTYWCTQPAQELAKLTERDGLDVDDLMIFELLHSMPVKLIELKENNDESIEEEY